MPENQSIRVSVDAVVFGYTSREGLSVLLIKRNIPPFRHAWALPGGLVHNEESLEEAVTRELQEETGVSIRYLEQLYTFGQPDRDPRNRVVSVAYFGLVRPDAFRLQAATDASEAAWFPMKSLPALAFDHATIVATALERLRGKLTYAPVGFELLDKTFPFSELEKLYQTVLDRPIDRRNFKKKILKLGLLEKTSEKQRHEGSGRPGDLYRFHAERYQALQHQGFTFEI
ncbi:8-oxo-dGTP diphosphatase [Catalinimonas alkaloidigena]|uniref:8-oxo-dGTP diphosphatase n=1 Tax=Catalinimonas alkaloidigena TaxID=1075417 RepID=A0A1G9GIM3_9BACT|nr:NUDIX domain-containing protein [Catalinimonas alkaloidigena]SDL00528.1 8-oxo-dGTP diphosphatase [Catalinimonas alkaloidigena]